MQYLHKSADSFLVKMCFVPPVNGYCHLTVSEDTVLFFVQFLYPFYKHFVYLLPFAWCPFQPFVIGTSADMQLGTKLFYRITLGFVEILYCYVPVFLPYSV